MKYIRSIIEWFSWAPVCLIGNYRMARKDGFSIKMSINYALAHYERLRDQ